MPAALHFTGDAAADELIAKDPLALLIGFALDQQITVQTAFAVEARSARDAYAGLEPWRAADPAPL